MTHSISQALYSILPNVPFLMKYIRTAIYVFGLVLAIGLYFQGSTIDAPTLKHIRLTQWYGFSGFFFLYCSLLGSPLRAVFPNIGLIQVFRRGRKAFGITAFFFALLHGSFAFFTLLGGFLGLAFLSSNYLVALLFGFSGLLILTVLAITSIKVVVGRMGSKWWKFTHRFVYVAGVLILIHVAMVGTHIADFSQTIPQVMFVALFLLLFLQALRVKKYLGR